VTGVRKLRVTYHRAADLAADDAAQFRRGGLLVRVAPPADLNAFDPVTLELVAGGAAVELEAQVVQLAAQAVAVLFDRASTAALVRAAVDDGLDAPPEHALVVDAPSPAPAHGVATARKIQQALHGNKDERTAILRDVNKQLHGFVLKNPQLGVDEVLAIAKMSTLGSDVLAQIAGRREWASRPDIAIALVRNPKTPTAVAVKLLEHVPVGELRQLAKDSRTRGPIQQAARRKIL
jgi:hypothetical protein